MRLLAACVGLLLVSGCGDDSASPDAPQIDGPMRDAPGQPDAPNTAERGVAVLAHLGVADGGVSDDANFFDFSGDGVPENSLASLSQLNSIIQNSITVNGLRVVGRLDHYDSATDDADVQMVLFHAFDADTDPNNDFGGMGQFLIDPASLDAQGNPKSVLMTGRITGGTLYAQATGEITLQLGPVTLRLVSGRIRAHVQQNGDATTLTSGILGGVLPACTAKQILIPAPLNTSLLDLITSRGCDHLPDGGVNENSCGPQILPDINLNGGGLDTFDNDFGTITACHHDGTTINGADCACDPALAGGDGYSAVQFFDAVPARIVGTAPPDAGSF
jgi:hypothetical protein